MCMGGRREWLFCLACGWCGPGRPQKSWDALCVCVCVCVQLELAAHGMCVRAVCVGGEGGGVSHGDGGAPLRAERGGAGPLEGRHGALPGHGQGRRFRGGLEAWRGGGGGGVSEAEGSGGRRRGEGAVQSAAM